MASSLTPKPRAPLFAGTPVVLAVAAMGAMGCPDAVPPMPGPRDGGPMPPPVDAFTGDVAPPMVDAYVEPEDAGVDADRLPPMPPPLDAYVEPDAGVIAPMPPPMPPPPMPPPPMPDPKG